MCSTDRDSHFFFYQRNSHVSTYIVANRNTHIIASAPQTLYVDHERSCMNYYLYLLVQFYTINTVGTTKSAHTIFNAIFTCQRELSSTLIYRVREKIYFFKLFLNDI